MSEIALYKALVSAGASEAEAQAAVQGLAHGHEVATKADLANLKSELIRWMVGVAAGVILILLAVLKLG